MSYHQVSSPHSSEILGNIIDTSTHWTRLSEQYDEPQAAQGAPLPQVGLGPSGYRTLLGPSDDDHDPWVCSGRPWAYYAPTTAGRLRPLRAAPPIAHHIRQGSDRHPCCPYARCLCMYSDSASAWIVKCIPDTYGVPVESIRTRGGLCFFARFSSLPMASVVKACLTLFSTSSTLRVHRPPRAIKMPAVMLHVREHDRIVAVRAAGRRL